MTKVELTKAALAQEERDIFAMAVQAAFQRFANGCTLENLRDIHAGVGALVRKLDRLEEQEAALTTTTDTEQDASVSNGIDNVRHITGAA